MKIVTKYMYGFMKMVGIKFQFLGLLNNELYYRKYVLANALFEFDTYI